jgi:D-alanyl-D-alanine carboxypeptidase/D-alanyl-D-alanine carboxypeptidase/D-alanyl-D-alanine-endopeptidase (penicillin-binding protein 4)
VDLSTGEVLTDLNPDRLFYIGSVRKLFTVAELLTAVGAGHHYVTKVYRDGEISNKQLKGNLILLASGDLAMGGHTNPDGSFAIPDFDHNEADSLGNAQLTNTNPILGYQQLAKQVKASGIDKISGDLVIDERLFTPFNFRGQFNVSSIFINDDVVDLHIEPTKLASLAKVDVSPQSAAFSVVNNLKMGAAKSKYTLQLDPVVPKCLGQVSCKGTIKGTLPLDFSPPLTHEYPYSGF